MSQRSPSLVVGSGQSLAQLRPTEVSFKVGGDLVSQRLNRVLWDRHIFVSSYQRLFAFIWLLYWRPVGTATVAVDSNGGEEDEENEVDNPEEVGVHRWPPRRCGRTRGELWTS